MNDATGPLAILCIFGLPICAYIVGKVLKHRERIELIRRGYAPPPDGDWKRAARQMGGPVGGPMPPTPPPPYAGPAPGMYDLRGPQSQLNKGIMIALIGLAITIGLSFIGIDDSGPFGTPGFHPSPALLGGLIPMFVGVAQIISAVLGGAQIGFPGPGGYPPPGQGQPGPFTQPGARRPYGPPPPPPPRPNPADELPPPGSPLDRR
ncbi:MAG: hypothetical protein WCE44_15885 [Candidatus Velthaea sp.]|jgi:hypothetical protein